MQLREKHTERHRERHTQTHAPMDEDHYSTRGHCGSSSSGPGTHGQPLPPGVHDELLFAAWDQIGTLALCHCSYNNIVYIEQSIRMDVIRVQRVHLLAM